MLDKKERTLKDQLKKKNNELKGARARAKRILSQKEGEGNDYDED